MVWTPRVTVAAVIEQEDRFLMVEERDKRQPLTVFNQPAGHLEPGESIIGAVVRETREETGLDFCPSAIIGIYRWIEPNSGDTYLRVCFTGEVSQPKEERTLDPDIIATTWLEPGELHQLNDRLRSPLVIRCVSDYLEGIRYPLELFVEQS